jgi:DNA-binding response OmpR family regulator
MVEAPHLALIVEDQKFLSSILKARLEREGIQAAQAFDGEEAITFLTQNKPGVVILDLVMPKASGFEVLEAMALNPQLKSVPVLVLSNLAQDEDIAKVKQLGVKEYFVKVQNPVETLVTRIKAYLPAPAETPIPIPVPQ